MIWKLLWVNIPSGVVALKVSRMDRRKLTLSLVHNRSSRMNHRVHVVCVRKVEALIKAGREEFTQHFSFFSICVSCCVTICKNRGWWFNFIQNLMAFFSLQGLILSTTKDWDPLPPSGPTSSPPSTVPQDQRLPSPE